MTFRMKDLYFAVKYLREKFCAACVYTREIGEFLEEIQKGNICSKCVT